MATVVVAIPERNDPVWNVSSEKVPHLTLLYLADTTPENQLQVAAFVQHAAEMELNRFGMTVDYRDTLGDDKADVLFFEKQYSSVEELSEFRGDLLKNDAIRKLYDAVPQFPQWTPHLTLGYPESPAKEVDHGLYYISFDKIAVWFDDFAGPEFRLSSQDLVSDNYASMSVSEKVADIVGSTLAHYGVKGMKWGVRRTPAQLAADSAEAASKKSTLATVKANKGSLDSVSNKDLQNAVNRMNLERQFRNLSPQTRVQKGQTFVKNLLVNSGKQKVQNLANQEISKRVDQALSNRG